MPNRELTVQLYTPHAGQLRLHNSRARFRVANCGRRFGKTLMGENELLKGGLGKPRGRYWWISPTYKQTKMAFEALAIAARPVLAKDPRWDDMRLDLINGSIIEGRSAEKYNNLRGPGLDGAVLDECRDIRKQAWHEVLRPMFSDTNGWAIFISTPRGHDWFWELAMLAQQPGETEHEYFSFPTSANPYISLEEIAKAKAVLPQRVFEQEYLAIFKEDGGGVFRGVDGCIAGLLEPPMLGHMYTMGWDIAKHEDFSVMSVLDCSVSPAHLVAFQRFNGIDYAVQMRRAIALAALYNDAGIIMDATGVGDPIAEQMQRHSNSMVVPFVFTGPSKTELVERLVVAIEQRQITYPALPELLFELKAYGYVLTAARHVSYGAPEGLHDDCVMSLGLAVYGARLGASVPFAIVGARTASEAIAEQYAPLPESALADAAADEAGRAEVRRREAAASHFLQGLGGPGALSAALRME